MLLLQIFSAYLFVLHAFCGIASNDKISVDRILKIYSLRQITFEEAWKNANDDSYKYSLIYYTESSCYVVNPTPRFISAYATIRVYSDPEIKIYRTNKLIDTIPFHMEQHISLGNDNGAYDYDYPYAKCSSYEIATRFIPGLTLDTWMAMVIHELFHNFQFQNRSFRERIAQSGAIDPSWGDSLQILYQKYDWYKAAVDLENESMIKVISSTNKGLIDSLINVIYSIRAKRRTQTIDQFGDNLITIEKYLETFEGTARYMEAHTLKILANNTDHEEFFLPDWISDTKLSDRYFYATGYNATRLLTVIGSEFKSRLFSNADISLDDVLHKSK